MNLSIDDKRRLETICHLTKKYLEDIPPQMDDPLIKLFLKESIEELKALACDNK